MEVYVLYELQYYPPSVDIVGVFAQESDALKLARHLIGSDPVVNNLHDTGSTDLGSATWVIKRCKYVE